MKKNEIILGVSIIASLLMMCIAFSIFSSPMKSRQFPTSTKTKIVLPTIILNKNSNQSSTKIPTISQLVVSDQNPNLEKYYDENLFDFILEVPDHYEYLNGLREIDYKSSDGTRNFFVSFLNPQLSEGDIALLQYIIEIYPSDSKALTRYNDSIRKLINDGYIIAKETTFLDDYPLTFLFEPLADSDSYAFRLVSLVNFIYFDTLGMTIILPDSDHVAISSQFTELLVKLHFRAVEGINKY